MTGNKESVKALDVALAVERRAAQYCHDTERQYKRLGYTRLRCWWHKQGKESRCRQRCLLDRLLALDVTPGTDIEAWDISPNIKAAYEAYVGILEEGLGAYREGAQAAFKAGDLGTAAVFSDNLTCTECAIVKVEARLGQIDDMGLAGYLSTQL